MGAVMTVMGWKVSKCYYLRQEFFKASGVLSWNDYVNDDDGGAMNL